MPYRLASSSGWPGVGEAMATTSASSGMIWNAAAWMSASNCEPMMPTFTLPFCAIARSSACRVDQERERAGRHHSKASGERKGADVVRTLRVRTGVCLLRAVHWPVRTRSVQLHFFAYKHLPALRAGQFVVGLQGLLDQTGVDEVIERVETRTQAGAVGAVLDDHQPRLTHVQRLLSARRGIAIPRRGHRSDRDTGSRRPSQASRPRRTKQLGTNRDNGCPAGGRFAATADTRDQPWWPPPTRGRPVGCAAGRSRATRQRRADRAPPSVARTTRR